MDELLRLIKQFHNREVELLACLAHELTVRARGMYPLPGQQWALKNAEMFRGINEVMHRLVAQIRAVSADDETRFPPDALCDVLREHAAIGGVADDLEKAAAAVPRRLKGLL